MRLEPVTVLMAIKITEVGVETFSLILKIYENTTITSCSVLSP